MYRSKSIMGENEVRVFKETNKIDRKIIQIIIDNFCVKLVEIQSLAVFGNPNIPSLTTEQSKTKHLWQEHGVREKKCITVER